MFYPNICSRFLQQVYIPYAVVYYYINVKACKLFILIENFIQQFRIDKQIVIQSHSKVNIRKYIRKYIREHPTLDKHLEKDGRMFFDFRHQLAHRLARLLRRHRSGERSVQLHLPARHREHYGLINSEQYIHHGIYIH